MAIAFKDISESLRHITLNGRLDIQGTSEIEMQFTTLSAAAQKSVVVDLSEVTFLASIGIRALIANAKAVRQHGKKMVLFVGNNSSVGSTLETTGVDALIPMFSDLAAADQAALA